MKIRPEHFEYLKAAIQPHDTPARRLFYTQESINHMRYRWDLTYSVQGLSKWISDNLYTYLDDTHIDSALRAIIPDFAIDHKTGERHG